MEKKKKKEKVTPLGDPIPIPAILWVPKIWNGVPKGGYWFFFKVALWGGLLHLAPSYTPKTHQMKFMERENYYIICQTRHVVLISSAKGTHGVVEKKVAKVLSLVNLKGLHEDGFFVNSCPMRWARMSKQRFFSFLVLCFPYFADISLLKLNFQVHETKSLPWKVKNLHNFKGDWVDRQVTEHLKSLR